MARARQTRAADQRFDAGSATRRNQFMDARRRLAGEVRQGGRNNLHFTQAGGPDDEGRR